MRTILNQQFHVLLPSIILANFSGNKFTSMGLKGVVISRFPSLLFVSLFQGWLVVVIVMGNKKSHSNCYQIFLFTLKITQAFICIYYKKHHNPHTILARQVIFLLTSTCISFIVKETLL